jgi:hypothetical protein
MPRPRPDFVNIRLSEAGLKMAGAAGTVGWANARRHFHFVAGEAQEVDRAFEWNHLLKNELFEGQPILEEVLDDDAAALPEPLRTLVDQEPGEGD